MSSDMFLSNSGRLVAVNQTVLAKSADPLLPAFCGDNGDGDYDAFSVQKLEMGFLDPVRKYMARPRKNFRSTLVECGYLLSRHANSEISEFSLDCIKTAVEYLHAGSLIIDDIQDGSGMRRGAPAFHVENGVPAGICVGNWMYFWPLQVLKKAHWNNESKVISFEHFHYAVEKAHYGQYLDLAVKSDEVTLAQLSEVSLTTAALKTGSITGLAIVLGFLAGGARKEEADAILSFGIKFGTALQRLDDWGNLTSARDPAKRFEDLQSRKPTTVWHDVVHFGTDEEKAVFIEAVSRLPNQDAALAWLANSDLPRRAQDAIDHELDRLIDDLKTTMQCQQDSAHFIHQNLSCGFEKIISMKEDLIRAYL